MRVIFVSKGFKLWAPVLGFFEILIWLAAIRQVLANLSNVPAFLAYALGFSMGNYVGMWVEEKLSVGKCLLRIHIAKNASKLFKSLTKANYPLTVFNAKNRNGSLKVISLVVKRQTVPKIIHLVEKYDPHVIYSIEDVRYATESRFVKRSKKMKHMFMPHRKGK